MGIRFLVRRKGLVCIFALAGAGQKLRQQSVFELVAAICHWHIAIESFESLFQCINKRRSESIIHSVFYCIRANILIETPKGVQIPILGGCITAKGAHFLP